MQTCRAILFAALGILSVSCRSTDSDARYQAWLLSAIKEQAASHKHVVLVCIYESHFQHMPPRHYHHLDCKGTVVHSYKGDWKVGEHIALHRALESTPEGWKPTVGYLEFLMLDEHTSGPIGIDVGDDWEYTPEFDRELRVLYSREARR